jgi:hypothetical protein
MQGILDSDIFECLEVPGRQLQVDEITKRQINLYTELTITPPVSLQ